MYQRTSATPFVQLSLLDYKPADPTLGADGLLIVNDETLFGHLLRYQETAEYRAELDKRYTRTEEQRAYTRATNARYEQKHPLLMRRRWAIQKKRNSLRKILYDRQGGLCEYSHHVLDSTAQIDHRRAMVKGGSDKLSNLALVCKWCNMRKGRMSEKEWRQKLWRVWKIAP